ncbi:ATP-dependent helicase [Alienimonas californiensis]|uniref:DNA 3'-5' helicase n=1 Tax=Alienimonas californiensis TaxID=2527989 RepID=A0A517P8R4_9PLAN|nr:UvrD-helicase domain-containing protein [Alienimonas californiensis]QDT15755.1 ATP-dependent DNA helicase PcrA [Alienimonas californiensis]
MSRPPRPRPPQPSPEELSVDHSRAAAGVDRPETPDDLTPPQRAAVEHFRGPLLVLAGPGSGKTRVITRRIARLVERGVDPRQILAITFTNKAAGEMADRVAALLPGTRVWVSTFHRFCSRLLRRYGQAVGLKENFSIYDTADQTALLRRVLSEKDVDAAAYPPGQLLNRIGRAKNEMLTAERFRLKFEHEVGDHIEAVLAKVYPAYQKALLDSNAVDFDDLLLHAVTLLEDSPELREHLDDRHRFILVDEYQDTNLAQYQLVKALSQDHPNLCATGDPDQSIYGWRGAKIENILRFERDYPGAKAIRLEENFRSTGAILFAADELIANNVHRKAKKLIGVGEEGEAPRRLYCRDGRHEADLIAEEIHDAAHAGKYKPADVAVFYRVNSLSRELELAMSRRGVPYQVAAGTAFYDRMEVKDTLAYLKLLANPDDRVAFARAVNKPKRGVGNTTQHRVLNFADAHGLDMLEAARRAGEASGVSKRAATLVGRFAAVIDALSEKAHGPVAPLVRAVLDESGLAKAWAEGDEEEMQRLANADELVTAAAQYDHEQQGAGSLDGFLETTALLADSDTVEPESGRVTLMTLHAAKGLEFPVVYVVGVEQNLLPHERSLRSHDGREIEEERRLLFVGVTRAMKKLTVTHTRKREVRGRPQHCVPSDFLTEMTLDLDDRSGGDAWGSAGYDIEDFSQDYDDSPEWEHPQAGESDEPEPTERPAGVGSLTQNKLRLTTAAGLLNGETTGAAVPVREEGPLGFKVGQTVRHPRYGLGTVTHSDGSARNRRVSVLFEDAENPKTFVASKAPLQPVG